MAVDSGTYTDDTVWRRRQIAQALADMNNKPIQHWTQGLSNLANTAVLSYDDAKLAQEGKQQDYEARLNQAKAFGLDTSGFKPPEMPDNGYGMIARLLGGGSKSAPTPTPSPAPNPVVSNAAVTPSTGANLPAPPVPWQSGPGFAEIGGRMMGDLQRDFKLTPEQAAGVVGNLGHESGGFGNLQEINPTVPGSRGGFGYAQWTGPRRVAFENWAQSQGLDPTSYDANYGFLRHELTNTPEGKVLDALRAAPDQDAATRIFQDQFLRPGIPHTGSRLSYAQQALGLAGGPPSAAVPFPSGMPQAGMPSFVPQGGRVQMAALPPSTMTDASPAGPAPASAETPSPGLPAFAQNGVPPVAMGAPSALPPASPQQPPPVAPPSPQGAAGGVAPASVGPVGVRLPDGIKRIAGALMASPRTAGQGQKMVTDFLVKELSRNPLDDEAKRVQIEQGRANLANAPTEARLKTAQATKAERELEGEGATPLTSQERAAYGIPAEQPAYKTRAGEIKFGPAASRTQVNVGAGETEEQKGRGKGLADRMNSIAEEGTKAADDALAYQRFGDLLSTVQTGNKTALMEKFRQMTGVALDPNTDNVQALNAAIQYLAPRLRVPGSGAQSDRELGNFLSSIPSLMGTPGGNQKILDTLAGAVRYKQARATIAQQWQLGDISAKEAQKQIDTLTSPWAVQKQQEAPAGTTGSGVKWRVIP